MVGVNSNTNKGLSQWLIGMVIATSFCLAYLLVPIYLLIATVYFLLIGNKSSFLFALPMLLSMSAKPRASNMALRLCRPMLAYFDFEEIFMDETIRTKSSSSSSNKRQYIFAAQPHGVLSFVGMCSAALHPEDTIRVPTAAASIVLKTPLLKHVMGIFNLIDASATSLKRHFKNGGSVVIYIGGIAELFKTSRTEERLYLQKRKGFIKLALTEGVDIVPVYLFGNSSVLSVLTQGPLVSLSRKLQASLTLFWGKFYLPIPRDEKLLYVVGKPMGLPHILSPTQDDIDKWHEKYCIEVRKIYETYQEKLPMYKHKKLFID
jgi:1-acyl-sn-glycerol-3-phosphate acyltransferase